jgi:hypothetical protein
MRSATPHENGRPLGMHFANCTARAVIAPSEKTYRSRDRQCENRLRSEVFDRGVSSRRALSVLSPRSRPETRPAACSRPTPTNPNRRQTPSPAHHVRRILRRLCLDYLFSPGNSEMFGVLSWALKSKDLRHSVVSPFFMRRTNVVIRKLDSSCTLPLSVCG